MRSMQRTIAALALAVWMLAGPRIARAETTPTSTITQMTIVSESSRRHQLYHGALWLAHDEARANYRWGGAHCRDQGLSDSKVNMLFAAFSARYSVNVEYEEQLYKGKRYRCVTGFTVRRS